MEETVPQREDTGIRGRQGSDTVLLPSFYLAPIEYYSHLYSADAALIEQHDSYQRQTYRNRCILVGANGPFTLTIPVERPRSRGCRMKDVRIAAHGNWRHLHWNAIISAYNNTPFFQYYEEEFRPLYEREFTFLHDFNETLRQLVCHLIGIETAVTCSTSYSRVPTTTVTDLRDTMHPKRVSGYSYKLYYQVFRERHGFIPHLSIIDLLFNMGNESRLFL